MALRTTKQRGFTLIELLVVIAIIAVLAVVVILTLNPAQLLEEARDSNRISDMSTLNTAISLFVADAPTIDMGTPGTCYTTLSSTVFWTPDQNGNWGATTSCAAWFSTASSTASSTSEALDGTGWIPINFNNLSSGAPISQEPFDPLNITGEAASQGQGAFFYSFIRASTTFKLAAFMESSKYSTGGSGDIESNDGGINNYVYEGGSSVNL